MQKRYKYCLFAASLLLGSHSGTAVADRGTFPQIGSIWWGGAIYTASPAQAAKVQLYLAPFFTATEASAVRAVSPATPILLQMNAMETTGGVPVVPQSYYLLDENGNMICDWPGNPGNFLLNMTNPAVVQFLAQYAYQQLTQAGSAYNGVFFDDVETTISTLTADAFGNPIQINDNYPGPPDPPATLNAAWAAGIYNLLSTFHQLAPNAYISVHANQLPPDPRALAIENGDALAFDVVNVREGTMAFGNLWDIYQQWFAQGQPPVLTAVQSSPPNQIAYGYGYTPFDVMVPSTVTFGQTWYPNMRFGLGITLMNNGYFIHDFGDTTSPVTWWYDEYDFNLGTPVTPATQIGSGPAPNEIINGSFEGSLSPWIFGVTSDGSAAATVALDMTVSENSSSSAHLGVMSAATADWHVDFEEDNLSLTAGQEYEVQFWALAGAPLTFEVAMQGGAPNYTAYGLDTPVTVGTTWNLYSVSFVAPVAASDGRLQFRVGNQVGDIWLDRVQLFAAPTRVYRRDFTNGVVVLNGTSSPQTISVGSGLQRFSGSQAPLYQYIVDDSDAGFTANGSWIIDTFDTGFRVATGPYYHAWKSTCHELDTTTGSAQWNLSIPQDGQYTIQVWLPAAPAAGTWTNQAIYSVMAGGQVVATATLNQSAASAGDQWFTVASNLNLTAASAPYLSLQNGGSGPLIADAAYVYSSTALYNNGSAAPQVTLAPFDSILLQRQTPNQTITFAALSNQMLGTAPFSVSATASSGLPVSLASNTSSVCPMSGNTVTLAAVGTCSITVSQPGSANFTAAVPVTQTFIVQTGAVQQTGTVQTISFAPLANQTAGTVFTVSATASSGLAISFASTTTGICTVSGTTVTILAGGMCSLTASQAGNGTYAAATPAVQSFTVNPVAQPVAAFLDQNGAPALTFNNSTSFPDAGGFLIGAPGVAQAPSGDTYIVGLDGAGGVHLNSYSYANQVWNGWQYSGGILDNGSMPGHVTTGLTAAVDPSGVVWFTGRDIGNRYWINSWNGTSFGGWILLDPDVQGIFDPASIPQIAIPSDGSIYVVGKDVGGRVWSDRYVPGASSFSGWIDRQGIIVGQPSVTAGQDGMVYAAVRSVASESPVYITQIPAQNAATANTWLNGGGLVDTDPQITSQDGTVYLLAEAGGNTVYMLTFAESTQTFASWTFTNGILNDATIAAQGGGVFIAGRDSSDRIYWYSVTGNSWFFAAGAGISSTVLDGGK